MVLSGGNRPFALAATWSVAVALSAAGGCGTDAPKPNYTVYRDSAGVVIASTLIDSAADSCALSEEVFRIGSPQGQEAFQLFRVMAARRLHDGRIAVLNAGTAEILVFSSSGEYLTSFGQQGAGPGEFRRSVWALNLTDGDTIVVSDYPPWRFNYFAPDGRFFRAVELDPPTPERLDVEIPLAGSERFLSGEACCNPRPGESADRTIALRSHDGEGLVNDTIGTFWFDQTGYLSIELRYLGRPVFGAQAAFAALDSSSFVYASGRESEVEVRNLGGQLKRTIRWSGRDQEVTSDEVDRWRRDLRASYEESGNRQQSSPWLEARISNQRPVAARFPAHDGLVVGDDGRIWVKEYRRPTDEGPDRWLGFHGDGDLYCQARIPEGTTVLDIGEEFVLGRATDELGVEYVVVWALESPSTELRRQERD